MSSPRRLRIISKKKKAYKRCVWRVRCFIMRIGCYRHDNIPGSQENRPGSGGLWFPVIKELIAFRETVPDPHGTLCVAWDKNSKGCKAFGIFQNGREYFDTIEQMPHSKRSGYEIILKSLPCKLYLDVEWETPESEDQGASQKIIDICHAISTKIANEAAYVEYATGPLDFYVSTCSRLKNKNVFKNSFHIVVGQVIFHNNHSGDMESFVRSLGFEDAIDTAVYTPNRCVRTELSSKFGQNAFFRNIAPFASEAAWRESLVHSLITIFDSALPVIPQQAIIACKTMKRKRLAPAVSESARVACIEPDNKAKTQFVLPQYFMDMFDDKVTTVFQTQEIRDDELTRFPCVVQELLHNGSVAREDVVFIYIKHPKCCVNKLVCDVTHAHHSNNSCAVAVKVNGRVDIYTRCYGCTNKNLKSINKYDSVYKLLPRLGTNAVFERIICTRHGINNVLDSDDRKRVLKIYVEKNKSMIAQLTENHNPKAYSKSLAYLWNKYITSAAAGWLFISEKVDVPGHGAV